MTTLPLRQLEAPMVLSLAPGSDRCQPAGYQPTHRQCREFHCVLRALPTRLRLGYDSDFAREGSPAADRPATMGAAAEPASPPYPTTESLAMAGPLPGREPGLMRTSLVTRARACVL